MLNWPRFRRLMCTRNWAVLKKLMFTMNRTVFWNLVFTINGDVHADEAGNNWTEWNN